MPCEFGDDESERQTVHIQNCFSWRTQGHNNQGNDNLDCDQFSAAPGSPSKCDCSFMDIGIPVYEKPSTAPSSQPSEVIFFYTPEPTTSRPSETKSESPSISSQPSSVPSDSPSLSGAPSSEPSLDPTISSKPSSLPSESPSVSTMPTSHPSDSPSMSAQPSSAPSSSPSISGQVSICSYSILYLKCIVQYSCSHPSSSLQQSLRRIQVIRLLCHQDHRQLRATRLPCRANQAQFHRIQ